MLERPPASRVVPREKIDVLDGVVASLPERLDEPLHARGKLPRGTRLSRPVVGTGRPSGCPRSMIVPPRELGSPHEPLERPLLEASPNDRVALGPASRVRPSHAPVDPELDPRLVESGVGWVSRDDGVVGVPYERDELDPRDDPESYERELGLEVEPVEREPIDELPGREPYPDELGAPDERDVDGLVYERDGLVVELGREVTPLLERLELELERDDSPELELRPRELDVLLERDGVERLVLERLEPELERLWVELPDREELCCERPRWAKASAALPIQIGSRVAQKTRQRESFMVGSFRGAPRREGAEDRGHCARDRGQTGGRPGFCNCSARGGPLARDRVARHRAIGSH